ncbi:hypothetical protein IQ07DRAFT_592267 [Pyrenochaeta sp. DS3sAY3a]|nr:hypothetical protein IQ07DRAFT_592267 [Pyrenochaeta sp. DS3sAY3a]
MSSSSPIPSSSPAQSRPASLNGQLAFLVHSPETVANHMPPDVDNKALARQKRRRTSKEDEDILKAEYQKNPKPDKTARLDIVSKVALGEKEVQIWFQNKRQNDRRRSRPLEPSSSASLMSSSSTMSDPPTEDELVARDNEASTSTVQPQPEDTLNSDPPEPTEASENTSDEVAQPSPDTKSVETSVPEAEAVAGSTEEPPTEGHEDSPAEPSSSQQSAPSASQPRTSWISNRRSASFVRYSEDYAPEVITFPNAPSKAAESPEDTSPTSRSLKRTHSFVRLSTNEDGTARIVTDLDKTPSPPHAKTNPATFSRAAAGLRRSYSAAGLNERLIASARGEPSPKMPRTSSNMGRSRDSRAWEFWCDPDSRSTTSLTTRAEQEGSGSAADAIGILRANRKILSQNKARQNTPSLSRHGSHKVLGSPGVKKSRGPMQRASTVSGRFSTKSYKKTGDTTESDEFPQTESDKENWEPDVSKQVQRDRDVAATPPASHRARKILGENLDIMSQTSSLGALLARERRTSQGEAVSDPEDDEEIRQFMEGEGASGRTNLSSAEEAGCVEGLLKLSQAQWR